MRFRTTCKLFLILFLGLLSCHVVKAQGFTLPDYQSVVVRVFKLVKERQNVREELLTLGTANTDTLAAQLADPDKRKVFWINLYNAMVQLQIRQRPEWWGSAQFFRKRSFTVAGRKISLDDIENKILRPDGKKRLISARYWRKLRPEGGDARLYFALNCGARSCPPIRFYTAQNLNVQMDSAAADFLREHSYYNPATDEIRLPAIVRKYRKAFSGDKGIRDMLVRYGILTVQTRNARLAYQEFDGTLWENNYQ